MIEISLENGVSLNILESEMYNSLCVRSEYTKKFFLENISPKWCRNTRNLSRSM